MKNWQEDLLRIVGGAPGEQEIFDKIMAATRALGFEYCAYGARLPLPVSNPKVVTLFDYPPEWTQRYHDASLRQHRPLRPALPPNSKHR